MWIPMTSNSLRVKAGSPNFWSIPLCQSAWFTKLYIASDFPGQPHITGNITPGTVACSDFVYLLNRVITIVKPNIPCNQIVVWKMSSVQYWVLNARVHIILWCYLCGLCCLYNISYLCAIFYDWTLYHIICSGAYFANGKDGKLWYGQVITT